MMVKKIVHSGQKTLNNRNRRFAPPIFCKPILFIKKFQNIDSFVSVKKWGKPASMNLNTQKRKFRNQLKGILYRKRRERSVPMAIFHVGVVAIR